MDRKHHALTQAFALLLLFAIAPASNGETLARAKRKAALAVVAKTSAHDLDSKLPRMTITAWLNETFQHHVEWSIVPGCAATHDEYKDRVCAIAFIPFGDDFRAGVYLDVGDRKHIAGPAKLNLAFWEQKRTGRGFEPVTKLSDFPEIISRAKQ